MLAPYLSLLLAVLAVLSQTQGQRDLFEKFQQNDYTLTPERTEIVRFNKQYVNRLECVTFKYNRTRTAFNITYNINYDLRNLEVVLQAFKFMSNEYRLFPVRAQYNYCKMIDANVAGLGRTPCGNFTGCVLAKPRQTYRTCNWTPDQTNLPPFVPSGRYMMEATLIYDSIEIGVSRVYATVTRPEV